MYFKRSFNSWSEGIVAIIAQLWFVHRVFLKIYKFDPLTLKHEMETCQRALACYARLLKQHGYRGKVGINPSKNGFAIQIDSGFMFGWKIETDRAEFKIYIPADAPVRPIFLVRVLQHLRASQWQEAVESRQLRALKETIEM